MAKRSELISQEFVEGAEMATWKDLAGYVRANYKVSDESPTSMKLVFDTGNLRSQLVMLWYMTLGEGGEEWLQIESPFAEVGRVDLRNALEEVGRIVCGGLALIGDVVTIRHAVPLANLNINEFERPLALVTNTADRLEAKLAGGDQF
jgi:hypothetical protein